MLDARVSRPSRRTRQWLALAILVPIVGVLMFLSLRWSDTSDGSVVVLRFDGISHPRTQFLIEVSTLDGTRMLQVGGLRIWILGDSVVFPASMVGYDGDYLSLPIASMSQGWRTLQLLDPEVDFNLEPRQSRYGSVKELEVLALVVPSDEFDPPIELVGRSIFVERREKLSTVLRVENGDKSVMDVPGGSSISRVPSSDVEVVAQLFEQLEPLLEE